MWLWRGWRPVYDRRDVACLARQLIAHGDLPRDTRLLCLTDRPTDWEKRKVESLGVLELPLWPELEGLNMGQAPCYPWLPAFRGTPNCYRRLKLLDPATQAALGIKDGDLVLSMDLDGLVGGSIRALMTWMACAAVSRDHTKGPTFMAMDGRVSRLHGSLWGFVAGTNAHVWSTFDPKTSPTRLRNPPRGRPHYVGSDQAWLSTVLPETTPTWGTMDHVWSWPRHHTTVTPATPVTYMSFAGSTKPRSPACRIATPWLYEHAMKYWED
jgi:hypothetical protein